MSVRPVTYNADGSIDVDLRRASHAGTIPAVDVL